MLAEADRRRRAYLERILTLLAGPERGRVLQSAKALVVKWERDPGVDRFYVDRWRELLTLSPDEIRDIIMADTDQAASLRHCMPFAGILSNRERAELRAS